MTTLVICATAAERGRYCGGPNAVVRSLPTLIEEIRGKGYSSAHWTPPALAARTAAHKSAVDAALLRASGRP